MALKRILPGLTAARCLAVADLSFDPEGKTIGLGRFRMNCHVAEDMAMPGDIRPMASYAVSGKEFAGHIERHRAMSSKNPPGSPYPDTYLVMRNYGDFEHLEFYSTLNGNIVYDSIMEHVRTIDDKIHENLHFAIDKDVSSLIMKAMNASRHDEDINISVFGQDDALARDIMGIRVGNTELAIRARREDKENELASICSGHRGDDHIEVRCSDLAMSARRLGIINADGMGSLDCILSGNEVLFHGHDAEQGTTMDKYAVVANNTGYMGVTRLFSADIKTYAALACQTRAHDTVKMYLCGGHVVKFVCPDKTIMAMTTYRDESRAAISPEAVRFLGEPMPADKTPAAAVADVPAPGPGNPAKVIDFVRSRRFVRPKDVEPQADPGTWADTGPLAESETRDAGAAAPRFIGLPVRPAKARAPKRNMPRLGKAPMPAAGTGDDFMGVGLAHGTVDIDAAIDAAMAGVDMDALIDAALKSHGLARMVDLALGDVFFSA
jgi:hypothetical protein